MAYPTTSFALRLEDIDRRLLSLKSNAAGASSRMAAGEVTSSFIFGLHRRMKEESAALVAVKAFAAVNAGFVSYVQAQKGDDTLNVATEFTAAQTAVDAVVSAIETAFPADGSGYLLAQTWGDNGPEDRVFTPAQTAGIRTKLADVVSAIG